MTELATLLERLRNTPAMDAKRAVQQAARTVLTPSAGLDDPYALPGDDTAAVRCGDHYQLLAIEGMLPAFVAKAPWFAGWSAVMANVSDIAAMGGRATAVVNAYWHHDVSAAAEVLRGIRDACERYGLLLAGGHTSLTRGNPTALAVAITGIARKLLSTLHVKPGQLLATVVDLDGQWHPGTAYWKAFEHKDAGHLRRQLELLPQLAEDGLLLAARDISNAGLLGSLLMLLEATGCGARIDLDALPRPGDGDLERWLLAFPSFGFLLTLDEVHWPAVRDRFASERLAVAAIGRIDASGRLEVGVGTEIAEFWDFAQAPFTGLSAPISSLHHHEVH
ncbi:sll0787 family AIR synthase-like protein [Pseudomonas sp. CR3202]|uniref:sll0787 family AIR synthase-like protein n=1 Tax=Pseudomonas sp. CR3202 TaxID=3351532 RepID=UPI003BF3C94B